MPYTVEQAKAKAKGIVKVQISLRPAENENRQVLIYNEGFKKPDSPIAPLHINMQLTPGVENAMGSNLKAYFYYRVNKVGFMRRKKEIELLHEAPPQAW